MPHSNPLAEVFGFPISNETENAKYYRENRLCPYHNRFPNCTKDKADDPLGVCSVHHGDYRVITCPSRFREDWKILHNTASFVWQKGTKWTSLPEVKLVDGNGLSAGNVDYVIVSYDEEGLDTIYTEFQAALEQVIYTKPGQMSEFIELLQGKLENRISNEPETHSVFELL